MAFILENHDKRRDDSESTGQSSEPPAPSGQPSGKAGQPLFDRCGGVFKYLEALDLQRRAGHMLAEKRAEEGKPVTAEELATLNALVADKICPVKK